MKIKVKNNGCAEVAYADLFGKVLILPGESTLEVADNSVKPLIAAMNRRAPQVTIKVIVDKPVSGPKPKPKKGTKQARKPQKETKKKADKKPVSEPAKSTEPQETTVEPASEPEPDTEAKPSNDGGKK